MSLRIIFSTKPFFALAPYQYLCARVRLRPFARLKFNVLINSKTMDEEKNKKNTLVMSECQNKSCHSDIIKAKTSFRYAPLKKAYPREIKFSTQRRRVLHYRTCFLAKRCSSDSSHRRDSKKRTSSSVCQMKELNP